MNYNRILLLVLSLGISFSSLHGGWIPFSANKKTEQRRRSLDGRAPESLSAAFADVISRMHSNQVTANDSGDAITQLAIAFKTYCAAKKDKRFTKDEIDRAYAEAISSLVDPERAGGFVWSLRQGVEQKIHDRELYEACLRSSKDNVVVEVQPKKPEPIAKHEVEVQCEPGPLSRSLKNHVASWYRNGKEPAKDRIRRVHGIFAGLMLLEFLRQYQLARDASPHAGFTALVREVFGVLSSYRAHPRKCRYMRTLGALWALYAAGWSLVTKADWSSEPTGRKLTP
jgi:hypothetical protein